MTNRYKELYNRLDRYDQELVNRFDRRFRLILAVLHSSSFHSINIVPEKTLIIVKDSEVYLNIYIDYGAIGLEGYMLWIGSL